MLVTTTPTVEGYPVSQYLRVVCGETIAGVNMFKDIGASLRNIVGGRSEGYEQELVQARETALAEMVQRAAELGAVVEDGALRLWVVDDGVGGASVDKGHGLAGLVHRLDGVDGRLSVASPAGGPTRVEAVIPCGS